MMRQAMSFPRLRQQLFQRRGIVERHHLDVSVRVLDESPGDRRLGGPVPPAHGVGVGKHREHHGVVVAVIRPLDLADDVAAGRGARHPDRVHRRFGARVGEADHLEVEAAADLLAIFHRFLGGHREVGAPAGRLVAGLHDARMGVPDDHGTEAAVKVDILGARPGPRCGCPSRARRRSGRVTPSGMTRRPRMAGCAWPVHTAGRRPGCWRGASPSPLHRADGPGSADGRDPPVPQREVWRSLDCRF